jgi:cardiolipin synthase
VNVPNIISLARLLSVPLAVWLILGDYFLAAFWLFVVAAASDAVDGFIAKRFNAQSEFGSYLDPLADKALLVSVYITLGSANHIPDWLVILVVSRDLMIVGGVLLLLMITGAYKVKPSIISKVNTLMQLVLAGVVLAKLGAVFENFELVVMVLTYLVTATTLISGAGYLVSWVRHIDTMEDSR